LFFGDSITDALRPREASYVDPYGSGYAFFAIGDLLREDPTLKACNRGISGNRIVDLYARLKIDCWNEAPDLISILVGVNEVLHEEAYRNGTELPRFRKVYEMLIEDTKAALPGVRFMLCEPFFLKRNGEEREEKRYAEVKKYAAAVKEIAQKHALPFVEEMTMGYEDPHILKIAVREKLRAGVFEYMDKYVYFNDQGMAMESRNHLFEGVPVVTGVEFEKLVLGEKIPVKGDYFRIIVLITKKISTYELPISEIRFQGEDDITLIAGNYKIYLGSSLYLEDKMSKISSVLSSVSAGHKEGTIDMHLYTDEKEIITFHK
jgi:cell division protein FtsQ